MTTYIGGSRPTQVQVTSAIISQSHQTVLIAIYIDYISVYPALLTNRLIGGSPVLYTTQKVVVGFARMLRQYS